MSFKKCAQRLENMEKCFVQYNERREKQAAAEADICFSQAINERTACDNFSP